MRRRKSTGIQILGAILSATAKEAAKHEKAQERLRKAQQKENERRQITERRAQEQRLNEAVRFQEKKDRADEKERAEKAKARDLENKERLKAKKLADKTAAKEFKDSIIAEIEAGKLALKERCSLRTALRKEFIQIYLK